LFNNISYINATSTKIKGIIPKVASKHELIFLEKMRNVDKNVGSYTVAYDKQNILFYRNSGGRYWKIITNYQPKFYLNNKKGSSSRESYLYFATKEKLKIVVTVLNSSLFYWYYIMHSDARTNNPSDLKEFPLKIELLSEKEKEIIVNLCDMLMKDLELNSVLQSAKYRTGAVKFQQFIIQSSKGIIDKIDVMLAEHYGFTEEELDFIINYDIKYRMGKELEEE
jgi:hypothetical protein